MTSLGINGLKLTHEDNFLVIDKYVYSCSHGQLQQK